MLGERLKTNGNVLCGLFAQHQESNLHDKICMMHDMHDIDRPSRNSITSIIIPSTAYLVGIYKTRSMPLEEVRDTIREKRHQFEDMMTR
jgi:hypothetical protein